MASDDEDEFEGAFGDSAAAVTGPRRSTFTPPPSRSASADEAPSAAEPIAAAPPARTAPDGPSGEPQHDDDELASALAADLSRLAPPLPSTVQEAAFGMPGPSPTVTPPADVTPSPSPADDAPSPASVVAEPAPEVSETDAPVSDRAESERSEPVEAPAWARAPAPDPAQAVPTPPRPVRRSLPDEALETILEEAQGAGTLDALNQLEAQMALRETEVREFRAWEATMLAMGTPDSARAVEEARAEFAGVLPRSTPARHADPAAVVPSVVVPSVVAPPTPTGEVAPQPNPSPQPDPEPRPDPEPQPDLAPQPEITPEPAAAPEPAWQLPIAEVAESAPEVPPLTTPVPLPSWDVPAPSTSWAPDEPETVAPPLIDPDPEPEPEPEPEPAAPVSLAAPVEEPPALIEPPRFIAPTPSAVLDDIVEAEIIEETTPPIVAADPADEPAPSPFSFDDLLSGAAVGESLDEELPFREEPVPPASAEAIFIEPLPVSADEGVPTDTGSIAVIDQAYVEEELDDDVDETDRVGGPGVTGPIIIPAAGGAPAMVAEPSGPIPTVRIPEDEVVLIDNAPVRQRVFSIEGAGLEPTPTEHRIGRAARLFWLWFAANSSIISLGLGAVVFTVGMSLRQSIVAILAGVALSFFPLGLTTLAGKRSGQPTMVVSRATFGVIGNVVPALIALITRVFWGAVLLWLIGASVSAVLVGASLTGPFGERQLTLIALGATILVAVFIAFAGYPLIARLQLILSILSLALIGGLVALTWPLIDLGTALSTPDGSWALTVTGAVLVFSFVGLVWANSGADLARYQRVTSSGAASMFGATFGATLPSFLLIGYGALLAASDPQLATGLVEAPLTTLARILPLWYPVPLIAAAVLSLLSGVIITLYSSAFALKTLGVQLSRAWSGVVIALPVLGLAMLFAFGIADGLGEIFRDAATTLAVPTAAWAGIFAAEMMIRNRRFESESLLRRGGVYSDVRWGNLLGLLVITAIGFGLTTATVSWLGWQGYLFRLAGVPLDGDLAGTDLGVLVALGLGILLPIIAGIPAIRRQEAARV